MTEHLIAVTPSAYEFPLLIKQLLITPIARASRNEIVYSDRSRYGYPEFVRRINRLGNVLTGLGAQAGDTVSVMDWDSHRYLECYFAVPMLGCVLQTVNIRLSPDQILYTLNHARSKVIVVHRDFVPVLDAIAGQLTSAKTFIVIDEDPVATEPRFAGEYEALMAGASTEYEFPDFDERTHATIFYTSGTTGLPKGVYYSHRQMVLHALGVLATCGTAPTERGRVGETDVYMPITPMFHAHAWGWPYAATLLGIKQVYLGRYTPEKVLAAIKREGATFSHCVPTLLQMMLTCPEADTVDLSRMKFLIGGSALPVGLAKMAMARGIEIFTGYGMSETGPLVVVNQLSPAEAGTGPDEQASIRARAGKPALLCDVRAVDEQMRPLPRDGSSVGEIVMRSPWLTQGYFDNPEASEALWRGGWLHTNDLGYFDDIGALRLTDRTKDVIKTGGEWVSSLELESLASQHPAVAEVAFIATPDDKWGERPMALIVLRPDHAGRTSVQDIRAHLLAFAERGVISKYAVPDKVLFVESLEKTSVGKLDKKVLRAKYAA
ncbi:MAG TPA: fatty acid--CoA ligase [Nevskiaceae bacterium]|nr:fatty acid--CoA ligase [Nevskiaceae bacterium]